MTALTKQAINHTLHCLLGCSIGEVLGMAIGQHWSNISQTLLAIILAFIFGYGLTFWGARQAGQSRNAASRTALRTDTISITSMEIVDNTLEWLIPGAINATLGQFLFWWSLALSLLVAFVITVPVNRYVMARSGQMHHH